MTVLIIIPTYNERDNLPPLVRALLADPLRRVMVVDDQSPDGTGEIADKLAHEFSGRVTVVHRSGKRGLGRSYVEGIALAIRTDVDLICQMDADFSHDPKYLPDLIQATSDADVVIGSRYLHGISVVNWPLRRLVLSTLANAYIRNITRMPIKDCTGAFRCWRRAALADLGSQRFTSEGYAFQVEMLYMAWRRGYRIVEVPIVFTERRQGSSKLSAGILLESVFAPWRLIARRGKPAR